MDGFISDVWLFLTVTQKSSDRMQVHQPQLVLPRHQHWIDMTKTDNYISIKTGEEVDQMMRYT